MYRLVRDLLNVAAVYAVGWSAANLLRIALAHFVR